MIADALAGKRIAVTGSTGFVGTALVERLLRSVPDCELVLLIRPSKRHDATERARREIFKNNAFDRLRAGIQGLRRAADAGGAFRLHRRAAPQFHTQRRQPRLQPALPGLRVPGQPAGDPHMALRSPGGPFGDRAGSLPTAVRPTPRGRRGRRPTPRCAAP